jgi:hypothetical protein
MTDPNGNLVPRFGSMKLCEYMTGDSLATIRRNIASNPDLARQNGRSIDVDLWAYLTMKAALPRPKLTVNPDRPGPFAAARLATRSSEEPATAALRSRRNHRL